MISTFDREATLSHFGDLVKRLRKERGMTLEAVAKKLGSHKGYVSGIETDKVNPPSVKLIRKFAKIFGQDARTLARLAWVDKAPEILREDAEKFLKWCQMEQGGSGEKSTLAVERPPIPLPQDGPPKA